MRAQQRLRPRPIATRFPIQAPKYVVRSDRCISCGACVTACTYGCHERSADDPRVMAEPKKDCCRACFACVFRCPRGALKLVENEEYLALGDQTYTPAAIRSLQEQASNGKVPVSGAGYGGPFDGAGYDGIWTDMSEIVRPTRDGIHGREDISTVVNLGRKIDSLCGMAFDSDGNLRSPIPPTREIAMPVMFGTLPFMSTPAIARSMARAAGVLTSYMTVRASDDPEQLREYFNHLIIRLKPEEIDRYRAILEWATIVEFEPDGDSLSAIARVRRMNPHLLTILRVPASPRAPEEILRLAKGGAETIHCAANLHGEGEDGVTLIDMIRQAHQLLVENGVRDQVTLLASGGISAAEHVPKTIILGADAVLVDVPLLIALECTVCGACTRGDACPKALETLDADWATQRIINLMLAWRDQLLEVLGAMGLRDVRRLRGETGRAIFAGRMRDDFASRLQKTPDEVRLPTFEPSTAHFLEETAKVPAALGRSYTNLSKFDVLVDRDRCTNCGLCIDTCPYGVHKRTDGKLNLDVPRAELCLGTDCLKNDWCCVHVCPWDALSVQKSNLDQVLGDKRWTSELLMETYRHAGSTSMPQEGSSSMTGASGGGFDLLRLRERQEDSPSVLRPELVDLSIPLNRRGSGPEITIPLPMYGGGMSYGSISLPVMTGRAAAAQTMGTFASTGEGGYPDELIPYSDHVITQIATGLFGVREETILRARLVEFKYAQGAKPGLGGHLLGEKNTPRVAAMREAVQGTSLFSPFPFHSVYSVEDHKKHLDWVRSIRPDVLMSVKVSTPGDVDMVAVGAYYAGANIIHLDGGYGGTGAAPDIAKKNIAQPIEYGVVQVHDFLEKEGIRDQVVVMASGGVRSPEDVLKAVALGADGVVLGTAELVAIDCVRCGNCERERGCPIGIATTDPGLAPQLTTEWVHDRIVNMYRSWALYLQRRLAQLGLRSIRELRGRRDLLSLEIPARKSSSGLTVLQGK